VLSEYALGSCIVLYFVVFQLYLKPSIVLLDVATLPNSEHLLMLAESFTGTPSVVRRKLVRVGVNRMGRLGLCDVR